MFNFFKKKRIEREIISKELINEIKELNKNNTRELKMVQNFLNLIRISNEEILKEVKK